MRKMIILLVSLLFCLPVYAYQTDSYEIELPNKFVKQYDHYYIYQEDEKLVTILINVVENIENIEIDKYDLGLLNNDNYLENIKNIFSNINDVTIDDSNINVIKLNGHNALDVELTSVSTPLENYNSVVYQRQLMLSSKNYLYNIIVTSNYKEELNSDDINNVINSFNMLDEQIVDNSYTNFYLAISIVVALWIFVFVCILTKKNRKKVKNIKKKLK